MSIKKCSKCQETKALDLFNRAGHTRDGRTSHCKACKSKARKDNSEHIKQQKLDWYESNKAVIAEKAKQARQADPHKYKAKEAAKYAKHKDKIKARVSAYQQRSPDTYRRAGKAYRDRNPHLNALKTARRRVAKQRATPKWADSEFEQFFLTEIYHLAQLRNSTGVEHHVDHIVPIISDKVCGLHCAANLRVIPARKNESKGNRYWPDMG